MRSQGRDTQRIHTSTSFQTLIAWPCFGIGSLSKSPLCPEKEKTLMAQEEDINIMKNYLHSTQLNKKPFILFVVQILV